MGDRPALDIPRRALTAYLPDRAERDEPAFTWTDRAGAEHTLNWTALLARVQALAARLRSVATPGDRVAVLTRQDLDYVVGFLGVLYAGLVAVPLFAPETRAHRPRLTAALRDSAPSVWLTSVRGEDRLRELVENEALPAPAYVIAVNEVRDGPGGPPADVGLGDAAYLQYTSGSTRDPAGAVITHRALTASVCQVAAAYDVHRGTTCAGWIPFSHDMGLIQLLCVPVFTGARSVFMEPLEFIRRPRRWLEQLSGYPDVFTAAPNFAYDLAVDAVPAPARAGLNLSAVRVALNGSEPVRPATIDAFADAFGPCGFAPVAHRPSYGLAEATVYVSSAGPEGPIVTEFDRVALARGRAEPPATKQDARGLVSVGRPVGQLVRIVDPDACRLRPDGQEGEVWVHGPHLAEGYWRKPESTATTFSGLIADPAPGVPRDGWLRTGDLGLVHEGQLYITGRLKDVIVIDGHNHYPQDIEDTVAGADAAIRRDRIAAFAVDGAGGEGVMVVAEHVRDADLTELDRPRIATAVRRAVAEHHDLALRAFELVGPGNVPRTSSGKVARLAARQRYGPR
ncbi:fatty acid CoA ligase FadD32 [Amycolatopsis marina]|uniref:Fatty acid CoA ligase FadD32 n=1 Tax=Amycolatopsis marina TaxID=490629 RepID=A0A1I1A0W7_9PSEU|nr:fatty acyl-AMP ligase [Amycolatopsis marina]SFB31594.1 fatty acid CoA ligase FadD32 [Amycolatopsis marina]